MKKSANNTIAPPTDAEIPALVDRAKELKSEIARLSAELKTVEARLEAAAVCMPHEPLKDEQREGRRVMLTGNHWRIPVIFTSDSLIKSFQSGSQKHKELLRVLTEASLSEPEAKELLKQFFTEPNKWETKFKDGQDFRAAANQWLPAEGAAKFIVACRQVDKNGIAKSTTVIGHDQAEPITVEVQP